MVQNWALHLLKFQFRHNNNPTNNHLASSHHNPKQLSNHTSRTSSLTRHSPPSRHFPCNQFLPEPATTLVQRSGSAHSVGIRGCRNMSSARIAVTGKTGEKTQRKKPILSPQHSFILQPHPSHIDLPGTDAPIPWGKSPVNHRS